MASLTGLARRAGWNIVDQGLSALGNMLLMFVVGRAVDKDAFGAFAIGFLIYSIAVAVGRSFVGQPLQIRHSDDPPERYREACRDAQGATLALGVAGGVGCALVGLLLGGGVGHVLLAVAVCLPFLMLQDFQRMAFITAQRPDRAALVDAVKVVAQFALLYLFFAVKWSEVGLLTLSWGVAAIISTALGAVVLGATPRMAGGLAWFRRHRDITRYLLAEYTLGLGAAQLGALLVPVLGSQKDAGAIRGSQTLLGPLGVLGTALLGFAVPEVSRRKEMGARQRVLAMGVLSGFMGVVTVVWVGILLVLPPSVGVELLGDSWEGARSVLLPLGVNSLAAAVATGPGAMLIGMGLARKTFRLNLVKAPILLGVLIPGTLYAGAQGAAWAMAISEAVLLPFWALTAWRAAHGRYNHLVAAEDAASGVVAEREQEEADRLSAEERLAAEEGQV